MLRVSPGLQSAEEASGTLMIGDAIGKGDRPGYEFRVETYRPPNHLS